MIGRDRQQQLLNLAEGCVHLDKVAAKARIAMMRDMTGGCYEEHLFRATMHATVEAVARQSAAADLRGALAAIVADPDCCEACKAIARDALINTHPPYQQGEIFTAITGLAYALVPGFADFEHRKRVRTAILVLVNQIMLAADAPRECPNSLDGKHHVDTSMESGPNNCFHCEADMGRKEGAG